MNFHKSLEKKNNDGYYPIHLTCKNSRQPDTHTLTLIQKYPLALQESTNDKDLPLHIACKYKKSDKVVLALLEIYPKAAEATNNGNSLPLHIACTYCQSEKVILRLLNQFPQGTLVKNNDNKYPLHCACEKIISDRVILTLIDTNILILNQFDSNNKTPLDYANDSGQSSTVIHVLEQLMNKSVYELQNRIDLPKIVTEHELGWIRRNYAYEWLVKPTHARGVVGETKVAVKNKVSDAATSNVAETISKRVRQIALFVEYSVGFDILTLLKNKKKYLTQVTGGIDIEIVKVWVKDRNQMIGTGLINGTVSTITTNFDDILNDDSIDMVIEILKNVEDAKSIVWSALHARKDVVITNKCLLFKHFPDIEQLLQNINNGSSSNNRSARVQFYYSAAITNIPCTKALQMEYVGDRIQMIVGIFNGGVNTDIHDIPKKCVLDQISHKKLGLALDNNQVASMVEVRSNLRILLRLAFGIEIEEDQIACRGYHKVNKIDYDYATMMGGTIKLVGVAMRLSNGSEKVAAFVSPCFISHQNVLSNLDNKTNGIEVVSTNLDKWQYIGHDKDNAIAKNAVTDIVALVKGDVVIYPFTPKDVTTKFVQDYVSSFYVRIRCYNDDDINVSTNPDSSASDCERICEKYNVSMQILLPKIENDNSSLAFFTDENV
jgi:homoserine dehydrogenase